MKNNNWAPIPYISALLGREQGCGDTLNFNSTSGNVILYSRITNIDRSLERNGSCNVASFYCFGEPFPLKAMREGAKKLNVMLF